MSLNLLTQNKGEVFGGFTANQISIFRVGEYNFLTRELLEGIGELAACRPDRIILNSRYNDDLPDMEDALTRQYLEENQGRGTYMLPSVYYLERAKLQRGNPVTLAVTQSSNSGLRVGAYNLSNVVAYHALENLVHGGLIGWPVLNEPTSAKRCRKQIVESKKPFFRNFVQNFPWLTTVRS